MTDAANIAAPVQQLRTALLFALQIYESNPAYARVAAIEALNVVHDFIESIDELRCQQLSLPLVKVAAALADLEKGSVHSMLRPKRTQSGRRPPETHNRQSVKGAAAATMAILVDVGFRREEAAKMVVGVLRREGVVLDRGTRHLKWTTVAGWRDRMGNVPENDTAAITYRRLMDWHQEWTSDPTWPKVLTDRARSVFRDEILASLCKTIVLVGA
jgi:hypothetical protein